GDYKKAGIGTPDKPEPVWISARYADPMTEEMHAMTMDAMMEAEMAEGEELIEAVRTHMYYSEYPPELGYAPVGTQLENFFSNGEWAIEDTKDKKYGKKIAVFKGIGTLTNRLRRTARRIKVTVRFAAETNANSEKKSLVITQISFNNETVYSRSRDYRQNSEIRQFDALYSMLGGGNAMSGAFSDLFGSNKYTLGDFLEMIYNLN
ncbi:MAG: hypothetical protein IJU98_11400, partial [Synergistaceae bacterium]|nr:hypothetical protein [Synergistaceae bacterium]